MKRVTGRQNARVKFLSVRHEIAALIQEGLFIKDIHRVIGLDAVMSYTSFTRYVGRYIKQKRLPEKQVINQKGHARVKFLQALPSIQELAQKGHCAKEIQRLLGLDRGLSYPSFAQYFAIYVKKTSRPVASQTKKVPEERSGGPPVIQAPRYDPQLRSTRVRSWAPPDPWPQN